MFLPMELRLGTPFGKWFPKHNKGFLCKRHALSSEEPPSLIMHDSSFRSCRLIPIGRLRVVAGHPTLVQSYLFRCHFPEGLQSAKQRMVDPKQWKVDEIGAACQTNIKLFTVDSFESWHVTKHIPSCPDVAKSNRP